MTKRRPQAPDVPAAAAAAAPTDTFRGRDHDRPVASGGRLRLLLGFLIGALIGALLALVLPRDDGPRRARPAIPGDPVATDPLATDPLAADPLATAATPLRRP